MEGHAGLVLASLVPSIARGDGAIPCAPFERALDRRSPVIRASSTSRPPSAPDDLFVVLPPGYAESDRRYPVAYLLHRPLATQRDWLVFTDLVPFTCELDELRR